MSSLGVPKQPPVIIRICDRMKRMLRCSEEGGEGGGGREEGGGGRAERAEGGEEGKECRTEGAPLSTKEKERRPESDDTHRNTPAVSYINTHTPR